LHDRRSVTIDAADVLSGPRGHVMRLSAFACAAADQPVPGTPTRVVKSSTRPTHDDFCQADASEPTRCWKAQWWRHDIGRVGGVSGHPSLRRVIRDRLTALGVTSCRIPTKVIIDFAVWASSSAEPLSSSTLAAHSPLDRRRSPTEIEGNTKRELMLH
jgi:hypothetical protein